VAAAEIALELVHAPGSQDFVPRFSDLGNDVSRMLIQSLDRFHDIVQLDPDTGQVSWMSRRAHPELGTQLVRGHFADLAGHRIYFYRGSDDELHVRVDDLDEPLNRQSRVTLVRRDASTNELQVHHAGLIALELAYARPVLGPPLSHDSTPFVDEEDFDICLLIYDVMSNAARRKRIYR
jgi:hypothetical protein